MCGFAGFLTSPSFPREEMLDRASAMAATLRHRGPDDAGAWVDAKAGIGFGFRRLAVIDLSPAGHQPMHSRSGRYTIVFNGEVYNFEDLRKQIVKVTPGASFRGHSDTEVILESIEQWGLRTSLQRFIGMFAFALWDAQERQLHLVRDRVGVKPLYYGRVGTKLLFGSQLKALAAYPDFDPELSSEAVDLLVRFGYVPEPHSIYRGIFKLPPGTIATFTTPAEMRMSAYWSLAEVVRSATANRFHRSADAAGEELDALLTDAVRLRMIADVPVGVFLSGGIDSSTVVAIAQGLSQQPVKTFTIGFLSAEYDEAPFARRVAQHFATDHHELYVSPQEAMAVIPQLPLIYDEPFADASQIPMRLVSALARSVVTVALSGDGGDELFGGYTRYAAAPAIWRNIGRFPPAARRALARLLGGIAPATWQRIGRWRFLPSQLRLTHFADKALKVRRALRADDADAFYWALASHNSDGFLSSRFARPNTPPISIDAPITALAERMMYLDTLTYLPDDILVKVDRASMSVGLEAREPLLDHRLIEFAWKLPLDMRVRRGRGKLLLRKVLQRYIPDAKLERPKSGFSIPLEAWLREPLREWADALLDPRALREEGVFDPEVVRVAWTSHLSGRANLEHELWSVLMFRAWNEHRHSAQMARADHEPSATAN